MAQHYRDPRRADDPHALPDVEVFYVDRTTFAANPEGFHDYPDSGWYYWFCFPGCMPDSEPMGPFDTEDAALADAREGIDDDDEGNA